MSSVIDMPSKRIAKIGGIAGMFLSVVTVSACSAPAALEDNGSPPQPHTTPDEKPSPAAPATPASRPSAPTTPALPFPAFTPSAPKVVNLGGKVLTNPVVVTITFPNDANAATYEAFGDGIGKSDYWKQIVSEYGVGEATSGDANHVRMRTALPTSVTFANRETYFTTQIQNGTWPAPTDETLYLVYIPTGTPLNNETCQVEGGDHQSLTVNSKEVAYAVVANCDGNTIDDVTSIASHEIAEAAVDPFKAIAYLGVGDEIAWEAFQLEQTETGDMCEFNDSYNTRPAGFPFTVQQQWSNKAAAAGHDPCVPAAPGAYFNVAVLDRPDSLTADLTALGDGGGTAIGKGFPMKVGESRTLELGFYSDAPTDAWTLSAIEIDPTDPNAYLRTPAATRTVTLELDKTTGKNGDKAKLTIKLEKVATIKASLVVLVSTMGGKRNLTPLLVGGRLATP